MNYTTENNIHPTELVKNMTTNQPITLYGHFLSMPTYKVALTLALANIGFNYEHIDITAPGFSGIDGNKPPELWAMNRLGQVPILKHGNEAICESNVILQYLAQLTGKFGSNNTVEQLRIAEWLTFDTANLSQGYAGARANAKFWNGAKVVIDYFQNIAKNSLTVMERHLSNRNFLVGEYLTIADIACYAISSYGQEIDIDLAEYPAVVAWQKRIEKLPGYSTPEDLLPKASQIITI